MSILLFIVGALAVAAGAAMVGFGIPINEFSFGNTLIVSGTTSIVGGLIVIGLGIAVMYLQRIAEALLTRTPVRTSRQFETFEPAAGARPAATAARIPFPTKKAAVSKSDSTTRNSAAADLRSEHPAGATDHPPMADYQAPTLPNPDEPPVTVEDDVSLSPQHPTAPAPAEAEPPVGRNPPPRFFRTEETDGANAEPEQPAFPGQWRPPEPPAVTPAPPPPPPRKSPTTYFDRMWPAAPKPSEDNLAAARPTPKTAGSKAPKPADTGAAEATAASPFAEPGRDVPFTRHRGFAPPAPPSGDEEPAPMDRAEPAETEAAEAGHDAPEPAGLHHEAPVDETPAHEAPVPVAILKSGVVDGMGYTLYVDGSIEAELPQGTLRFASINELRRHLEKTA